MMRKPSGAMVWALGLWGLTACAGTKADTKKPSVATADPDAPFENKGGMWTPAQMAEHAAVLEKLGVQFNPKDLTDPTKAPLSAIVSLGGCSASFVSDEGLIITNHHCVVGALSHNSTKDHNLLHDGFVARTRDEEPWAGPGSRVLVTKGFTDVTDKVAKGLDAIADDFERYRELKRRTSKLESGCKRPDEGLTCSVASYYEGAQYVLVEQLELRDVRLVYAPHAGIGVFGGDVDNWRWPRHTGDFAFLRAYVGEDGKSAPPSASNVPFEPPHHLEVAKQPLQPDDFVMVAGYPGTTSRLTTAGEVKDAVTWRYPRLIAKYTEILELIERLGKARPEVAIKAASTRQRLANYKINFQGMLDGLVAGGLADDKGQLEKDLQAWIAAKPKRRKRYGDVLAKLEQVRAEQRKTRDRDAAAKDILEASTLVEIAGIIYTTSLRRAGKSGKAAALPPSVRARVARLGRRYDPELDRSLLGLALVRAAQLPPGQRPDDVLTTFLGDAAKGEVTKETVDAALAPIYKRTKLGRQKERDRLLDKATAKGLERSRDPFFKLIRELTPVAEQLERRRAQVEGAMAALRPRYVEALREFVGGPMAPDANRTLRITFGTVRGYRPKPGAKPHAAFTTLPQMVAKHTGTEPFAAPKSILEAAKAEDPGPWVDERLGQVPVDFLADLDITGGNSGSATLNAKAELVGLAFDGNYESIASDWLFMPAVTRSIHVDIRYVLFVLDRVDDADHIVTELGAQPTEQPTK